MRTMKRLLLVAGIIALPPLMASLDSASDQSFRERQHERRLAAGRTASVAAQLDDRLTGVRTLLSTIAASPAIRDAEIDAWQGCAAYLAALDGVAKKSPSVLRVSVSDGAGIVRCSSDGELVGQTSGSRGVRDAWRSGEPQITQGRRREPGTLELAQRVEGANQQTVAVIAANVSIADLVTPAANRVAEAGDMVFIFDGAGEVLVQAVPGIEPRDVDRMPADLRPFLFGQVPGDVEAFGPDGRRRVFAYAPSQASTHGLAVAVGIPLTAQGTLLNAFAYPPFVVGVVALLLGVFVGWAMTVRPERKRMRAAVEPAPAAREVAIESVAEAPAPESAEPAPAQKAEELPRRARTASSSS